MDLHIDVVAGGGCATCEARHVRCDEALPTCHACQHAQLPCAGYSVRIQWPADLLSATSHARMLPKPAAFSSLGLPPTEDGLVLHYMRNIAKLALAVDYHGNGYRKFAALALHEPVILNAVLAVARAHLSKWQGTTDLVSRHYLKKAVSQLQQRFRNPRLLRSETTVVVMLLLSTYEVFNGSAKWKHHYKAIAGWVQAYASAISLDPFLKTWITLIDTQSGLNCGSATIPQVAAWSAPCPAREPTSSAIDPFLGCSVNLPRLMVEAAQLYKSSLAAAVPLQELHRRIATLHAQIRACKMVYSDRTPSFVVTCQDGSDHVTAMDDFTQYNHVQSAIATAEIFRHATLVYVHRIGNEPTEPLSAEFQQSVDDVFSLLPKVPDAVGPGANLGWALVVIGAEIDDEEKREYIRCRWKTLQVLGMGNAVAGASLLEDLWSKRDAARPFNERMPRWQDVMRSSGAEQILI